MYGRHVSLGDMMSSMRYQLQTSFQQRCKSKPLGGQMHPRSCENGNLIIAPLFLLSSTLFPVQLTLRKSRVRFENCMETDRSIYLIMKRPLQVASALQNPFTQNCTENSFHMLYYVCAVRRYEIAVLCSLMSY